LYILHLNNGYYALWYFLQAQRLFVTMPLKFGVGSRNSGTNEQKITNAATAAGEAGRRSYGRNSVSNKARPGSGTKSVLARKR
jgi:hypothetical protein